MVAVALSPASLQPADRPSQPSPAPPASTSPVREAPAGSGLARRPNPKLADRTPSGTALRPFTNHRKLGAVYHTVAVRELTVSAPLAGLRSSPSNLAGYLVARVPMDAASNGALGPVIVAGQWQLPWSSLVDDATLARWSSTQGGPLKLDDFPFIAVTIRNAMDTKLLSKDGSTTSYMCTVVADISINGITTERVIQRTLISFIRDTASDQAIRGEQLSLRAKFQLRLSDFFSSLPGEGALSMVDVNADLLMSTVSPDGQRDDGDGPAPQDSLPASGESESSRPSEPAEPLPNEPPAPPPSEPK